MKLKITERKLIQKETNIDLPIYLYSQDEYCMDEYIKWDGKEQTIIKYNWFGFTVERTNMKLDIEEYQLNNLCSETDFIENFNKAIKDIQSRFK